MINFQLISLDGVKFSGEAYEIILPTMDGEIGVVPGHMPLISVAERGVISIRRKQNEPDDMMEHFAISSGAIEVSNGSLNVLVDEADASDDISEEEAREAMERAQKLKAEAKDQVSLQQAQNLIDRSAVRIQVAGLKRRGRRG